MMKAGVKLLKRLDGLDDGVEEDHRGQQRQRDLPEHAATSPAPSRLAASYMSCGICRRPARKMIIGEPNCQIGRMISVHSE